MSNRFKDMLVRLQKQTAAGAFKWQTTADENSFRIGLGGGMVRITRVNDREEQFTAHMFDQMGREVESRSTWQGESVQEHMLLQSLFVAARRSALDADALLDSMEKDLAAGKFHTIEDPGRPDEDLPF